jgi:hypothetical protein
MFKGFSEQEIEENYIEYKEELVPEKLLTSEAMVKDYVETFCTKNKISLRTKESEWRVKKSFLDSFRGSKCVTKEFYLILMELYWILMN